MKVMIQTNLVTMRRMITITMKMDLIPKMKFQMMVIEVIMGLMRTMMVIVQTMYLVEIMNLLTIKTHIMIHRKHNLIRMNLVNLMMTMFLQEMKKTMSLRVMMEMIVMRQMVWLLMKHNKTPQFKPKHQHQHQDKNPWDKMHRKLFLRQRKIDYNF